jgi:hypothetical protein
MAGEVDKMMDFQIGNASEISGFTRSIARVRDVANYIVPTADMGRGVACFWFKLPNELSVAELSSKFREFARTSSIFLPNSSKGDNASMHELASMTHLAEGGYMGIYECGGGETNEYMLAVQSYDMYAASAFSANTFQRVRDHVDEAPNLEMRDRLLDKLSKAKAFLGQGPYETTMNRSKKNRMYLAANFFDAFGIYYHSEPLKIHGQEDTLAICSELQLIGDYPCTFLKREGSSFLRLFNAAYSYADLLKGAPWHLPMHEGLRTFVCPEEYRTLNQDKFMNGVAMGSPHLRRNPMVTEYNREDASRINSVVTWQSPINTMYVADPRMRVETKIALTRFKRAHNLVIMPDRLWRTLGIAILPPDMDDMTLRELIAFSDTNNIRIPTRMYGEIMDIWLTLHEFKEHHAAFARDLPSNALTDIPVDYALPKISDLFMNEKTNAHDCEMERDVLKQMVDNNDKIVKTMQHYDEQLYDTSMEPRMHEKIRREAQCIPPPTPPTQTHEIVSYDDPTMMPIGESGSEASTGMSETDVRTLRKTSRRREQKHNARARLPPNPTVHHNQRKPETLVHKHIPLANNYYEHAGTEDEGLESDYYRDLAVASTDDDRL